ncbi:hypothetical protein HDU92_004954 [Lobulomyces angularis]|nr:hypothetical protein HDU92_004954 [Lobulomyces angularis]
MDINDLGFGENAVPLPSNFDVEKDGNNLEEIEKQWAVKAFHHAETYENLIKKVDGKKLKLTKDDLKLYKEFREAFPDLNIAQLDQERDFGGSLNKEKWRNYIASYEKTIEDYNFGTLLRLNSSLGYHDNGVDNTMFATRLQFLAIEVARNMEGLNSKMLLS